MFGISDTYECAVNNGGCDDECIDTDGSYYCSCDDDGYELAGDKHTCIGMH